MEKSSFEKFCMQFRIPKTTSLDDESDRRTITSSRHRLLKKVIRQVPESETECSRISEGNWSFLPTLLLWLIKDKLDIFDDTRLSAVCSAWRDASALYPTKKQTVGDGMPWIMKCAELSSSVREFICISAERKRFSVDSPELIDSTVLFSRKGWLLMHVRNCVFLMNPVTKDIIKMPYVEGAYYHCIGTFSTTREGYPHIVALWLYSRYHNDQKVTIKIASPADQVWTVHSYAKTRTCWLSPVMVINGRNVYCFVARACWGVVFNLDSKLWKELSMDVGELNSRFVALAEFEGELLQLCSRNCSSFSLEFFFFRFNDIESTWERLNNDAIRDTYWFAWKRFCPGSWARGKGLKVYHTIDASDDGRSYFSRSSNNPSEFRNYVVQDIIDGSADMAECPFRINLTARLVDIG